MTQQYYSVKTLKLRGWTDSRIKQDLGPPDKQGQNPYYRTASPTKLYLSSRVHSIEDSDNWQSWLKQSLPKRQALSASLKAKAEEKRQQLIKEALSQLTYSFPSVSSVNELTLIAIDHYVQQKYEWLESRERYGEDVEVPTLSSPPEFLNRITVNYLRHCCSNYDEVIESFLYKVGRYAAYEEVKTFINHKAEEYISSCKPLLS
jgi:hypothetical protein